MSLILLNVYGFYRTMSIHEKNNDLAFFVFQVHIGPDDWMSESALHSKKPWRAVLAR